MTDLDAIPADDFERLYQAQPDPWQFASSSAEQARYRALISMLRRRRYTQALEPACSIGALSAQLAERCEHLLALDVSASAVARAREHCAHLPQIEFGVGDIRTTPAAGAYDLIVFSELGYYFSQALLRELILRLQAFLIVGGEWVACHWLGHSEDHLLHGDEVHQILQDTLHLKPTGAFRCRDYRIDSWVR